MQFKDIVNDFFFALWVFLPAGLGNMVPILVAKSTWQPLKAWQTPIDCGRTFRGKRIFGAHKTWRGLISGMIASTIVLAVQQFIMLHSHFARPWVGYADFAHLPTLIVGPLFGLGALGGDAIKSFFKRQRGIPPGETWYPFDQIDLPVGALVATWPFIRPSWAEVVAVVLVWWLTQIVSTHVGFWLHLKDKPL